MPSEDVTPIETALHELLRRGTVAEQLIVIAEHPILSTPVATRAVRTLIERAETRERRDKLFYLLGIIEAAAANSSVEIAPEPAANIIEVYEQAILAQAARAGALARPQRGLAWAGCIVGVARTLNGMRSFGHGLASPDAARTAAACLQELRIAANIFAGVGAEADCAHANHELAGLLFEFRGAATPGDRHECLKRALSALRAFRKAEDWELIARSHQLAGTIYRQNSGDLVRNQERAIFHHACAQKYYEMAGEREACAEALYSSCAIWSERIVGHARQNFSIAQTCIRAARAIWTKDRKPLAVARADYLWATCLRTRPFDRAAGIEEAINLLQRVLRRLEGFRDHPQVRTLAANAVSALGQALRERARGRRRLNLQRAATALSTAASMTDRTLNPRDWTRFRLQEAVVAIDLAGFEKNAVKYARRAINDVIAAPAYLGGSREALTTHYWDGVVAAYEGDWARSAAAMKTVVLGQDMLLKEQRQPDGLVRTLELLSGLATIGTYSMWRAHGAETAFAFLADVRRPLASRARKPRGPREVVGAQTGGDSEIGVAPIVTPLGGVLLIAESGGQGQPARFHATALPNLTLKKLQAALKPWIAACLRASDDDPSFEPKMHEAAFLRMSEFFGRSLAKPLHRSLRRLPTTRKSVVSITPVGGCALIPFHALPIGGGDILWSQYTIVYRPWPRSVDRGARPLVPKKLMPGKALLVIDPDDSLRSSGSYEGLAIGHELSRVGMQIKRIGTGHDPATAAAFFSESEGAEIVHVAAHGYFDWRDPRGSGIALAGGRGVAARAISKFGKLSKCRLCVLSACESGVSDPGLRADAFIGLAASFLEAGAKNVIAALWPIPVEQIADRLIVPFYRRLLRDGLSPEIALRQAALEMRSKAAGLEPKGASMELARLSIAWAPFACFEGDR